MRKPLLHRLFGLGKIPGPMVPILQQEGIMLLDEGLRGTVTFRNFRAPGKRYSWRRNWFMGSLVLTQKRFAAFTFSKPIINVTLEEEWLDKLSCSLRDEATLCVVFEAADFHEAWSGSVECRFSTPQAHLFLERLRRSGSV